VTRGHPTRGRRDPNEPPIIAALQDAGALVYQLEQDGIPDLLVGYAGRWLMLEIKSPPGKNGGKSRTGQSLSEAQAHFFAAALLRKLPVHVVHNPREALAAIGAVTVFHPRPES
jgi:hypothetical protein